MVNSTEDCLDACQAFCFFSGEGEKEGVLPPFPRSSGRKDHSSDIISWTRS